MIPIPLATKWGQAIHALDLNQFDPKGPTRGVRPVDDDTDGALLREAMSIRGTHQRVDDDLRTMLTFRDIRCRKVTRSMT